MVQGARVRRALSSPVGATGVPLRGPPTPNACPDASHRDGRHLIGREGQVNRPGAKTSKPAASFPNRRRPRSGRVSKIPPEDGGPNRSLQAAAGRACPHVPFPKGEPHTPSFNASWKRRRDPAGEGRRHERSRKAMTDPRGAIRVPVYRPGGSEHGQEPERRYRRFPPDPLPKRPARQPWRGRRQPAIRPRFMDSPVCMALAESQPQGFPSKGPRSVVDRHGKGYLGHRGHGSPPPDSMKETTHWQRMST